MSEFRIESVTADDVPALLRLIEALAVYEKLSHEVVATEATLRASLFGPRPGAEAVIVYAGHEPAGFAVFFHNSSTFLGRPGMYLEDLFVRPEWRGRGLGRRLMAHVAGLAVERQCGRMEWSVLGGDQDAVGFSRSLGAGATDQWTVFRLTGDDLRAVAASTDA